MSKNKLYNFTIQEDAVLLDALKKIDINKKGFVIVQKDNEVVGILTDGDIRRALIKGFDLNTSVKPLSNKNFSYIRTTSSLGTIIEKFKSEELNFLPILDANNELLDILTKKQFHVLMLKYINFDLSNLPLICENDLDYEIFSRPWGFYKSTILAEHFQSKIINVFPDSELSLQEHKKREEHWIIITGEGKIILGESVNPVYPGKYVYIPKGCKHKIINTSKKENLIFVEVQLGSYFGEDDIIRYEDKYGRIKN